MSAYYNEIDKGAAQWLRNLITAGLIAPGEVDERSITEVEPNDLRGFKQCHFFAGLGGWSLALRLAGWPDEREVWTGSCPCQPFSHAGKGGGADDERHLWPAFCELIAKQNPPAIFGEQVASAAGRLWLTAVRLDLETLGYACGAADLCAAGIGAPHIRQRLFWGGMEHAHVHGYDQQRRTMEGAQPSRGEHREPLRPSEGCGRLADSNSIERGSGHAKPDTGPDGRDDIGRGGEVDGLAASKRPRLEGLPRNGHGGDEPRRHETQAAGSAAEGCPSGGVAEPTGERWRKRQNKERERDENETARASAEPDLWPSILVPCADGKARPVPPQPALFPLAYGLPPKLVRSLPLPSRTVALKGAGNAIVPQVAAEFVAAFMEATT